MKKLFLTILLSCALVLPAFSASWEVQDARNYYANGQYSQALKSITSAIEGTNYNDPNAYDLRAKIYIKLNSPISAIKDLSEEIEILNVTKNSTSSITGEKIYSSATLKQLYVATNQRGDLYLKTKDYENALNDYNFPFEHNKKLGYYKNVGAEISIKNFKKVINDKHIPALYRVNAIIFLLPHYNSDIKTYLGAQYKLAQIIANADENDELFSIKSKQEFIQGMRKEMFTSYKVGAEGLGEEMAEGMLEYALGNKALGLKIINGTLNELKTQSGINAYNSIKEISDYIINVLDNGL